MTPPPQLKFAVAPHFHLVIDWSARIQKCGSDASAWQIQLDATDRDSCALLFALPEHLRARWWTMLEQSAGSLGDGALTGFDDFTERVADFLAFKRLRVPDAARFDAVVHAGKLDPLTWGIVNLGAEEMAIVFSVQRLRLLIAPGEGVRLPDAASGGVVVDATDSGPQIQLRIVRAIAHDSCDDAATLIRPKEDP